MLLAQVPQTARVSKKEVKPPDVAYQGEPEFETIETTSVARATNTDKDIFKVGRPLLHVLPGRLVHVADADRPLGSHRLGPAGDLRDSRQLARRTTSPTSRSKTTTTSG